MKFNFSDLSVFSFFLLGVETAEEYLEAEVLEVVVEEAEAWVVVVVEVEVEVEAEGTGSFLDVVLLERAGVGFEEAGMSGRGSVCVAIVHIVGRVCTVDAKETLGVGVACASLTRFLASPYEIPSVALTAQTSFSSFQEGQSLEKEE